MRNVFCAHYAWERTDKPNCDRCIVCKAIWNKKIDSTPPEIIIGYCEEEAVVIEARRYI